MPPPPPPPPDKTGPRPNPFRDAGPYGTIEIGGVTVPGIIQDVGDYTAKQDWNFQKAGGGGASANSATPDAQNNGGAGTGASTIDNVDKTNNTGANFQFQKGNATSSTTSTSTGGGSQTAGSFGVSVWRGALLVEEAEIVTVLLNADDYDAWIDFMKVVMPKRGRKPPSLSLVNPNANAVGVNRCAVREIAAPKEDKPGSGKWIGKVKICEYNPQKTAAAGKADPAKPPAEQTPQDAQEQELKDLLDKARQ